MRILYGVQTTGNGHLSRSSLVVQYLKELGADVRVLFSGANQHLFWDTTLFEPYSRCQGLTFVTHNGRISNVRTALQLNIPKAIKDINQFPHTNFDVVVTDFEPLSARIAKKYKIPSIGVSHQAAFHYAVPKARFNYTGKVVTQVFAPVDINLGLHWHHFEQPVLPPIVDTQLNHQDCTLKKGKVLVYLPFENRDLVRSALLQLPHYRFHIYEKRNDRLNDENLIWNPFSREKFKQDLLSCEGVMCQSGFELPSEAIHLGKKLLVKPVYGQFEQLSNAMVISQYRLGKTMNKIDPSEISDWFNYPNLKPANYPNVAKEIARWITKGNWNRSQELSTELWN